MEPRLHWEYAKGTFFLNSTPEARAELMDEATFDNLITQGTSQVDWRRIDYKVRVSWLQENGYSLTLDNILNNDLPTIPANHVTSEAMQTVYDNTPQEIFDLKDNVDQQTQALADYFYNAERDTTSIADLATTCLDDVTAIQTASPVQTTISPPIQAPPVS